jgi:hypothetical protein
VRPTFFAGQLLAEDDLDAISVYVTAKNRLHNRYLVGAGVVCGLEVRCHRSEGGKVVVTSGYAVDCCGEDLYVPCDVTVDVVELVRTLPTDHACLDPCLEVAATGRPGSGDARAGTPAALTTHAGDTGTNGNHGVRRYLLGLEYVEQDADSTMTYSLGCGHRPSCEPTRRAEGFRFVLQCEASACEPPTLAGSLQACLGDQFEKMVALLGGDATVAALQEVQQWLLARYDRLSGSRCDAACAIRAVVVDDNSLEQAAEQLRDAVRLLVRDCVCRAANPVCAPCCDTVVPLARLTVDECEVVEICMAVRDYVLTGTTMRYWLAAMRDFNGCLRAFCCGPGEEFGEFGRQAETVVDHIVNYRYPSLIGLFCRREQDEPPGVPGVPGVPAPGAALGSEPKAATDADGTGSARKAPGTKKAGTSQKTTRRGSDTTTGASDD